MFDFKRRVMKILAKSPSLRTVWLQGQLKLKKKKVYVYVSVMFVCFFLSFFVSFFLCLLGATAPTGPWPPLSRGF